MKLVSELIATPMEEAGIPLSTTACTYLGFGAEPEASVTLENNLTARFPIDQLADFVHKNSDTLSKIVIRLPSNALKAGLVVIDTPVLEGSARWLHGRMEAVLKDADACVLLLEAARETAKEVVEFLKLSNEGVRKFFVFVGSSAELSATEVEGRFARLLILFEEQGNIPGHRVFLLGNEVGEKFAAQWEQASALVHREVLPFAGSHAEAAMAREAEALAKKASEYAERALRLGSGMMQQMKLRRAARSIEEIHTRTQAMVVETSAALADRMEPRLRPTLRETFAARPESQETVTEEQTAVAAAEEAPVEVFTPAAPAEETEAGLGTREESVEPAKDRRSALAPESESVPVVEPIVAGVENRAVDLPDDGVTMAAGAATEEVESKPADAPGEFVEQQMPVVAANEPDVEDKAASSGDAKAIEPVQSAVTENDARAFHSWDRGRPRKIWARNESDMPTGPEEAIAEPVATGSDEEEEVVPSKQPSRPQAAAFTHTAASAQGAGLFRRESFTALVQPSARRPEPAVGNRRPAASLVPAGGPAGQIEEEQQRVGNSAVAVAAEPEEATVSEAEPLISTAPVSRWADVEEPASADDFVSGLGALKLFQNGSGKDGNEGSKRWLWGGAGVLVLAACLLGLTFVERPEWLTPIGVHSRASQAAASSQQGTESQPEPDGASGGADSRVPRAAAGDAGRAEAGQGTRAGDGSSGPVVKGLDTGPAYEGLSGSIPGMDASLERALARWAGTIRSGNLQAQLASYAPFVDTYFNLHNVRPEQILYEKERNAKASRYVSFEVTPTSVTDDGNGQKTVVLKKDWRSANADGTHSVGSDIEKLEGVRIDGNWKIVSEQQVRLLKLHHE